MAGLADMLRERAKAALPPTDGEFTVGGLHRPVEVLWDRWGVPHIYATDMHDLFFAQGYVTASERLFQIELMGRIATGCLSEAFGELTVPLDRFVRTVGWNRAARRHVQRWDARSSDVVGAFAAGVRAWIERMPARPVEYEVLQLDPWFPDGDEALELVAAGAVLMAWGLSGNWDNELLRAELADRLGWDAMCALFPEVGPEPSAVVAGKDYGAAGRRAAFELLRHSPASGGSLGSNNWVVAGSRSKTGIPLLANDPHLFVQVPAIWFEVHLNAPGIDVRGVAVPFAPGVTIGHNDRIAWGFTNVGGDTQDLYVERLDETATAALHDGRWERLTSYREEIAVRGRSEPEVVMARETRHGPILDAYMIGVADPTPVPALAETYALRWVGLEEPLQPSTVLELDTARDFDQFRAAAAKWASPGQNFLYADVDGNIGYQCTGWYPIRRRGDGTMPVPGWTSEHEWDGYVPFEELPWSFNPPGGFLVTANNKIHDDSYPHLIGKDFFPPFRARRIAELLTATPKHDRDSFRRIHRDTVSLPAMEIVPRLLEVEPADDRQKQALALLAEWDFDLRADSAAAALYEVWCIRIADAVLRPRLGEDLYQHYYGRRQWTIAFQYQVLPNLLRFPTAEWFGADGVEARDRVVRNALDDALDELTARLGEDMTAWTWGAIHRVRFAGRLAVIPEVSELFTVGEGPHGGDEQTVNQGTFEPGMATYDTVVVSSWRQIIDLSDLDASVGTHTVGQSANPASPHFKDLYPLWANVDYHGLPFTRPAVERATESRLVVRPDSA